MTDLKKYKALQNDKRSPFRSFSDEYLESIAVQIKKFRYSKKEFLFREGFKPLGMFFIVKGKVKIFKASYNEKEVILSIAGENEFLGFQNLLNDTDYKLSGCATESTEVLFIPKRLFRELADKNPDFLFRLFEIFADHYHHAIEKLVDVATKQVSRRVAEMLIGLMKKHGTKADGKTLDIILSREDLAQLVATNTETLVRTLSDFKNQKLVALYGKRISVSNLKMLKRAATKY